MAYNVNFISGKPVALPKVPVAKRKEMAPLLKGKGHIINYRHHSVIMNKKRKFAFFSAWGIFKKDKRAVSASYQLKPTEFFPLPDFQHISNMPVQQRHWLPL
ncbi:MAG: hypothetical protein NVSMB7_17780 [Chitinophagaceae bacterium]